MYLSSEQMSFFDQLYAEFHGVVIAKSVEGKYLYANKTALMYMKRDCMTQIQGKKDNDFKWPFYIAEILDHTSNITRFDYTGTKLIPPIKVVFQRTPFIKDGEIIAKIHTLSFISTNLTSYKVSKNGSVTIMDNNNEIILSKLEVDIARWMVFQYSAKETAELIYKSTSSVNKYRTILYQKFNCDKKDETIKKMLHLGLLHYFLEP